MDTFIGRFFVFLGLFVGGLAYIMGVIWVTGVAATALGDWAGFASLGLLIIVPTVAFFAWFD